LTNGENIKNAISFRRQKPNAPDAPVTQMLFREYLLITFLKIMIKDTVPVFPARRLTSLFWLRTLVTANTNDSGVLLTY